MSAFLNQHSFLLASALLLGLAWALGWKLRRRWRLTVVGALGAALAVAFVALRTGGGHAGTELAAALRGGLPVAVELYSDY